jgi:hypothetical protein
MGDWMLLEMMENVRPKAIEPVVQTVEVEVKYYTTANAKTYHTRECFSIRNATELIEMTAEEGEASGRKACGNCLA